MMQYEDVCRRVLNATLPALPSLVVDRLKPGNVSVSGMVTPEICEASLAEFVRDLGTKVAANLSSYVVPELPRSAIHATRAGTSADDKSARVVAMFDPEMNSVVIHVSVVGIRKPEIKPNTWFAAAKVKEW